MILIGYSGHAFVVCGILLAAGRPVTGYCDIEEKQYNPFNLIYLGQDASREAIEKITDQDYFIAVGDNAIRRRIFDQFEKLNKLPSNAIHPSAIIDHSAQVDPNGVMISAGVCINPLAVIGRGAICNTGSIIEHECKVGEFAHIGPGAVLCGNVTVGDNAFVGAASVIRQGVVIGKNAMIGAGAVVVKNIQDNEIVIGNPSRALVK
jgi:sugar O-acyltransferase (sialic acid O-acetyltransferase NeuD family)